MKMKIGLHFVEESMSKSEPFLSRRFGII